MTKMIVISVDDLAQWAGPASAYAAQVQTPNIDRLLATGVNFTNAYTPEAICNAARTATLSGMMSHNTGVHSNTQAWEDYVHPDQTWPAMFLQAGYDVGGFGKILHDKSIPDHLVARMFSDYHMLDGYTAGHPATSLAQPLPDVLSEADMADTITVDHALAFLDAHGDGDFLLNVGLFKPHLSWVVPQEYFDLYPIEDIIVPGLDGDDLSDVPAFILDQLPSRGTVPETIEKAKEFMQGYLASVSYVDAQIGRLLDGLEQGGLFDDTNIVLWSDHGFHLGDHDNTWGKFTLWEEAARVPLIIKTAGNENAGAQVDEVVNLVDLFPTLADMAGLTPPDHLDGQSLMPLVSGQGAATDGVSVTWMYGSALLRTDQFAYILYEDGSDELYDMQADPGQSHNLAASPGFAQTKQQLQQQLFDIADLTHVDGHVQGTADNDSLVLSDAGDRAAGGLGDDLYFINHPGARISEQAGQGMDAVFTSVSFALPDHVENLHVKQHVSGALTVTGNGLDNHITLAGPDQVALGGGGNDLIHSTGARSHIEGGTGDDKIIGGFNDDSLFGGDGNDTLFSGGGQDRIAGEAGDDILHGGRGNSNLSGGSGDDILNGGGGDEILIGGAGADLVLGGDGTDRAAYFNADSGVRVDLINAALNTGDAAGDVFHSIEDLQGSAHADDLRGSAMDNLILGGDGNDRLAGRGGDDHLSGGAGDDHLEGGLGADLLEGGAGRDTLTGHSGTDQMSGGAGDDVLHGNRGADVIDGGDGHDRITGGEDRDHLSGGAGNDLIDGNKGADMLLGGTGQDQLNGQAGNDTLSGDEGADTLRGGMGHDLLHGGRGDDSLLGDDGADILFGEAGDDQLDGGTGRDLLQGGAGDDLLTGGLGADRFVFDGGADQITDFTDGRDQLVLDSALWGGGARSVSELLDQAQIVGADLVFDFGGGNRLTLLGWTDKSALLGDISIL